MVQPCCASFVSVYILQLFIYVLIIDVYVSLNYDFMNFLELWQHFEFDCMFTSVMNESCDTFLLLCHFGHLPNEDLTEHECYPVCRTFIFCPFTSLKYKAGFERVIQSTC